MQIRNKSFLLSFFILFISTSFLYGEELNISAKEILIDKEKNIVTGIGSVKIIDKEGNTIKSDKAIYKKSEQFVLAEGNVDIRTTDGTLLKTSKATYNQVDNLIVAYDNSELYELYLIVVGSHLVYDHGNTVDMIEFPIYAILIGCLYMIEMTCRIITWNQNCFLTTFWYLKRHFSNF